jgi:hypothetical protein
MGEKRIAKVTKRGHIDAYLKLWNGNLQLSIRELEVAGFIINEYMTHKENGLIEPYLSEFLFDAKAILLMKKALKMSNQNWANYKSSLKAKRVLVVDGERVCVNTMFLPKDSITFEFEIID